MLCNWACLNTTVTAKFGSHYVLEGGQCLLLKESQKLCLCCSDACDTKTILSLFLGPVTTKHTFDWHQSIAVRRGQREKAGFWLTIHYIGPNLNMHEPMSDEVCDKVTLKQLIRPVEMSYVIRILQNQSRVISMLYLDGEVVRNTTI